MQSSNHRYLIPLCFIGVMFFAIGFALGVNSYLVPLLEKALAISSGESYLVDLWLSRLDAYRPHWL